MRRSLFQLKKVCGSAAAVLLMASSVVANGQNQSSAPPPPADVQPSLQEAAPPTDVRAVRLSDVQGTVQILEGSDVDFKQAQLNMPVVQGMRIVASEDGRAEIQFEDGSVARVTPNSSITMAKLGRSEDGSTVTVIQANRGLTYYELNGRGSDYTVKFGVDGISPNDGSIFRVDLDSAPVLSVMHGSVHISNSSGLSADIHTNQTARFDVSSPNEYQLLENVAAISWDQWNSDRDDALAELDQSATEVRADTGNPDNPAWSDLDAYGSWYDVPGYGAGWAPSGVGEDWDPYGLGSWGYYSGVGYTWISGYQWGWWPYRCGAWNYFDGFGWMWFPGNCGWGEAGLDEDWYPYAVIQTMPVGYKCLRRPAKFRRPGHGPVPHQPLVAINRGPEFAERPHSVGVRQPAPRLFHYDGRSIAPIQHSVHLDQGGPMGESFSATMQRTNPDTTVRRAYGGVLYQPSNGGGQMVYRPNRVYTPPYRGYMPSRTGANGGGRVFTPAPSGGGRVFTPAPSGGGRVSAPEPSHSSAPVFHAPESHSAGHSPHR
jgi:hypothetical protein